MCLARVLGVDWVRAHSHVNMLVCLADEEHDENDDIKDDDDDDDDVAMVRRWLAIKMTENSVVDNNNNNNNTVQLMSSIEYEVNDDHVFSSRVARVMDTRTVANRVAFPPRRRNARRSNVASACRVWLIFVRR